MTIDIRLVGPEQHAEFVQPLLTAFGLPVNPEAAQRTQQIEELTHRFAAYEEDKTVGCAGTFSFTMTVPGGEVPTAGLTMVGVVPTRRRRGIMTALLRTHLDQARADKQPVSALWATEPPIYTRFGYGLGSMGCSTSIEGNRARFSPELPRVGSTRIVTEEEALSLLPDVYERARRGQAGMLTRSTSWWKYRTLVDTEKGPSPLCRVVLEIEGRPEAYAIYRFMHRWDSGMIPAGNLQVQEAIGTSSLATRLMWRYLFEIDLVQRVEAVHLPPDHPLLHSLTEPRRLRINQYDAVWVRILDVPAALASRSWGSIDTVVLDITDPLYPSNTGRFRIDGASGLCVRTERPATLRIDIGTLGTLWMGAATVRRLADAGRVEELQEGAIDRADALFRSSRAPWCPAIF
ncbi:GNAT family N-acetyltransferase [Chondromyces apiculatus]|uniref:N-acetyltransferase domain-containing protein n=1 Tax=Chondromyces apiculatus DSM 436 TaxID=1192034 RepID=A0A017STY6_9BACT|nr:GNAT family N-acetyltransferase [Chondromyces apiculatus]EYF00429.1 Hypothetical protein CAP_0836 [Chondromyces apiculatus DSM 436]